MNPLLEVTTTFSTQAEARALAKVLIDEKLAGCVQISGPIESHYQWQGKVEQALEWSCSIKTSAASYDRLEQRIIELHPYDEPQIIALPIHRTSKTYGQWLRGQLEE